MKILSYIIDDIKSFDIRNTDEKKVLDSKIFSFYKGHPVLRVPGRRSASLWVLFITYETNKRAYPEDIVRHEYGHTEQLRRLGFLRFGFCIGIPSRFKLGSRSYYDKPWEVMADVFGGVMSRHHDAQTIADGEEYLRLSREKGIKVWRTIK